MEHKGHEVYTMDTMEFFFYIDEKFYTKDRLVGKEELKIFQAKKMKLFRPVGCTSKITVKSAYIQE